MCPVRHKLKGDPLGNKNVGYEMRRLMLLFEFHFESEYEKLKMFRQVHEMWTYQSLFSALLPIHIFLRDDNLNVWFSSININYS